MIIPYIVTAHAPERNEGQRCQMHVRLPDGTLVVAIHPTNFFAFRQSVLDSTMRSGELYHAVLVPDFTYTPDGNAIFAPPYLCWN